MIPPVNVDGLNFTFPDGWIADKYDDWQYYRRYAQARSGVKSMSGVKAVDLVVIDTGRTAWLIEVKDYRRHQRTKAIDLAEEVSQKVHDTLAALVAAQWNAHHENEGEMARSIIRAQSARIILHLEQPPKHSTLFPRAIDASKLQLKLRTLLKPIDPHSLVVEMTNMRNLAWVVS